MKRIFISSIIGFSLFSFVSCGDITQDSTSNKFPVDNYLTKGATLETYLSNGTAVMKDTNGDKFFVGNDSTYKVELNKEGVVLPFIVIKDTVYYFENKVQDKNIPDDFDKLKGLTTIGGYFNKFFSENISDSDRYRLMIPYANEDTPNTIYTTCKGIDGYKVWSSTID